MRTRMLVAAAVALGLVATGCGDSKNDSLKGVALIDPTTTAVRPTTTPPPTTPTSPQNVQFPAAYPGTTVLNLDEAFVKHSQLSKPWGFVERVGSAAQLTPDMTVFNPGNAVVKVSGVITSLAWQQLVQDPITVVVRTSRPTASALAAMAAGQDVAIFAEVFGVNTNAATRASEPFYQSFVLDAHTRLKVKPIARQAPNATDIKYGASAPMEVTIVLTPPTTAIPVYIDRRTGTPLKLNWGGPISKK